MLTYNNHDTFKRCISSMTSLLLDERVKEFFILDNGSHEIALIKLLKSVEQTFNKIRVIYGSENLGIAKGRKMLYELCNEEYVLSFDSDVAIVNSNLLLEMFLNSISIDKMMLVGGGGGNHPFFPAVFRNDIINLPTPDKPNEVALVDEVAGWFHGFKTKDLKCNGGKLYMDEQFSPFWAEDSDFCYQIKLLGGKCCIIGRGSVAHVWSSCHDTEKQKPIEAMWKKLTDKWYPKFNTQSESGQIAPFHFDINERFYLDNYAPELEWIEELEEGETWKAEKGKIHDVRDHFFVNGMRQGFIPHKKYINTVFKGVQFISNTQLKYKEQTMHTRDFIDKYMNHKHIIEENFRVIENKLPSVNEEWPSESNVIFFSINEQKKGLLKLKELVEVNPEFIVIICGIKNHVEQIHQYLKKEFKHFFLCEFTNYYDHTIPFVVTMQYLFRTGTCEYNILRTERILKLVGEGDFNDEEQIQNDLFGIEMILDVYRYRKDIKVFKNGIYDVECDKLRKIIYSTPVLETLDYALRYPCKYTKLVSPKFVPNLALTKIVELMVNNEEEIKKTSLFIYFTSLEDKELVSHNNEMVKESDPDTDIVMLSYGKERFVKPKDLNADYLFLTKKAEFKFENWFSILADIPLKDYSNIIFFTDGYKIEDPITDFIKHSKYQNIALLSENNVIDYNLFSIISGDIISFVNMVIQIYQRWKEDQKKKEDGQKTEDMNLDGTINLNVQKNFGLRSMWYVKKTEEENETIIEYCKHKDKFTPDEDFPLNIEE
jgi:hypothetical protein